MFTVNKNPSPRDLRYFAWTMLLGFNGLSAAIITLMWWRFGSFSDLYAARNSLVVALVLISLLGTASGLVSLFSSSAAERMYILWMSATVPVGIVMSTIMLTVLFVVLLPVFSVLVRRSDPLRKKLGGATYWEDYKHYEPTLDRMARPF